MNYANTDARESVEKQEIIIELYFTFLQND